MKKNHYPHFSLLLVLGILLGACGSPTPVVEVVSTEEAPVIKISIESEPPVFVISPSLLVNFWESIPADTNFGLVSAVKLSEELATDNALFLLDIREPDELEEDGYIEGAVNVPIRSLLQNLDKLPGLDEPIVIYCGAEHRGGLAMMALKMLGYTQVRNMGDCRTAWKDSELPIITSGMPNELVTINTPVIADEALFTALDDFLTNLPEDFLAVKPNVLAQELANHPVFLDVRLQAERDADGYIDGSILIPFPDFLKRLNQLPAEKDTRIVVYCTSGHRGSMVTMALHLLGYTNAVNLAGGLNAWKADGMEVIGLVDWEAVLSEFIANLPSEQGYYSISADELSTVQVEQPVFLVDVREPAEVEGTGHIEGAVNIPIRELLKNLDKLPAKDQRIVVYCEPCYSGAMGTISLRILGYSDVVNLDGGVNAWKNAGFPLEPGAPVPAKILTPAPEVDATRLTLLDAYLTAMPEDFSTVTADEVNVEMANGNVPLILDVRNESDISADVVFEGAVLMPVHTLPANLAQLPAHKVSPIVIVCKSAHCGAIAKMYLNFLGYINVRILLAE